VGGDEVNEGVWPAERTVDPGLVSLPDHPQDDVIIGRADNIQDNCAAPGPLDAGEGGPFRHGGQVQPGSYHWQRLCPDSRSGFRI
jgi:hypothetical protein